MKAVQTAKNDETLTFAQLIQCAAAYKGLEFKAAGQDARSETFASYKLDEAVLEKLAKRGIIKHPHPSDEMFTLLDENHQERVPGWMPSNYWNINAEDPETVRISLSVGFNISKERRGVTFFPFASGNFFSPTDRLPNFRMFQALVEMDLDASCLPVAREIAASKGSIAVPWTDLGLGGIRSVSVLFEEFFGEKENIVSLARDNEVFDPQPYPENRPPGAELFIPEPLQPTVVGGWKKQLEVYRNSLV